MASPRTTAYMLDVFSPLKRFPNRRRCHCKALRVGLLALACALSPASWVSAQDESLNVLDHWIKWNDPGSLLLKHLLDQASVHYQRRDQVIAQLKTEADWRARQHEVSRILMEIVGPFPEKTPLNPQVLGVTQKDGYRIEKLVFESMPNLRVVGCLFVPDGEVGKRPAILNFMGHYQESFRAADPLKLIVNLVQKGFVVLTIDPPGQGENVQCYEPSIEFSSVGYSVIEHSYIGNQCFLAGVSPGRYFLWDGIRAIDYLCTRAEVDPSRIGVTGFSGGGTITSYVAAFDERVKVSIPSAWSTASRRQLDIKGVADAETVFVRGLVRGITFEDLIEVRAPKPTMLVATTRDQYLPVQGAREAYREVELAYQALGKPEHLAYAEDDARHAFTKKNDEAIYAFFQRHLDWPGDSTEYPVEVPDPEELRVTSSGQLSTSFKSRFIFDINKEETATLTARIGRSRRDIDRHLAHVRRKAQELSGYQPPTESLVSSFHGRFQRDGYTIGLRAIETEGYVIPMLVCIPETPDRPDVQRFPAVVYLHPEGKAQEAGIGGELEQLIRQGFVVIATDVLGIGETANAATRKLADDNTAILIGRSVVGIQAGDIAAVVNYARSMREVDGDQVGAMAIGDLCPALLHAAALDRSLSRVALIRPLLSYRLLVTNRLHRVGLIRHHSGKHHPYEIDFMSGVAGALTAYDLPDLMACIAPRRIVVADAVDQTLEPAAPRLVDAELEFPRSVFLTQNADANLRVVYGEWDTASIAAWCFEN